MNTNDLPPAAKLAALIETGRAANPDIRHGRTTMFRDGAACAIGFAALGAGVSRTDLLPGTITRDRLVSRALGLGIEISPRRGNLLWETMMFNDTGVTLEAVCCSLREGALATAAA